MENIHKNTNYTKALLLVLLLIFFLVMAKLVNAQAIAPETVVPLADTVACTDDDCESLKNLPLNPPGWKADYNVRADRKERYYLKVANKALKASNHASMLANAAYGLKLAEKKKLIKKLTALLTQSHYDLVYDKHLKLEAELGYKAEHYTSIASASHLYELLWSYKRLLLINTLIDRVSDKVSIQTKSLDLTYIGELEGRLTLFREQAATEYFLAASYWLNSGKDKNDFKRSAYYFKVCRYFKSDYPRSQDLYEKARKIATSHIYVAPPEGRSTSYTLGYSLDEDVRKEILSDRRFTQYLFVDIVTKKGLSDYTIRLVMDNFSLTKKGQTSDTKEYSKEVEVGKNSDGIPITQTKIASVTTHVRAIEVGVKINVEVIENKTQTVLHAIAFPMSYVWETAWQTSKGDLSIVKSKYKTLLGKKPDTAPHRNTLFKMCAQGAAPRIAYNLVGFFAKFNSIKLTM